MAAGPVNLPLGDNPGNVLEQYLPEFIKIYLPKTVSQHPYLQSVDEYTNLAQAIYATIVPKYVNRDNEQVLAYIHTDYLNTSDENLDRIQRSCESLSIAQKSPVSMIKALALFKAGVPNLSRNAKQAIIDSLNVPAKNRTLEHFYPDGDVLHRLQTFIAHVVELLEYHMKKARYLVQTVYGLEQATAALRELEVGIQNLQTEQITKEEASQISRKVTQWRTFVIDSINNYLNMNDNNTIIDGRMCIPNLNLRDNFELGGANNIVAKVENLRMLYYVWRAPNNFDVNNLQELRDIQTSLSPLIKEIAAYVPSTAATARNHIANIKPQCDRAKEAVAAFREADKPSLGEGKGLIVQLKDLLTALTKLERSGVNIDEDTVGVTIATIGTNITTTEDYVYQLEMENKREDARAERELTEMMKNNVSTTALKIKKLRDSSDWLEFNKSYQAILPYVKSTYAKRQILRDALVDKDDIDLCEHLDHEAIIEYLQKKYSSPDLVCKELQTFLTKRHPDSTTGRVKAINKFLLIYARLQEHKLESELDYTARQKLPEIVLPPTHLATYKRELAKKNMGWKEAGLGSSSDGSISTELDKLQREFVISEVKIYLEILTEEAKLNGRFTDNSDKRHYPRHQKSENVGFYGEVYGDSCVCCDRTHFVDGKPTKCLLHCPDFRNLPLDKRQAVVRVNRYCSRCLHYKHPDTHPTSSASDCVIGSRKQIMCKHHDTPTPSHHPILCHKAKSDYSGNSSRGGDDRRGGGGHNGGGRGGRGGARGGGRGGRGSGNSGGRNGNSANQKGSRNNSRKTDVKDKKGKKGKDDCADSSGCQQQSEELRVETKCDTTKPADISNPGLSAGDKSVGLFSTGCSLFSENPTFEAFYPLLNGHKPSDNVSFLGNFFSHVPNLTTDINPHCSSSTCAVEHNFTAAKPRLTLANRISCFSAAVTPFEPTNTRAILTAATTVTAVGNNNSTTSHLGCVDCGSGIGFIRLDVAQGLKLPKHPVPWNGTVDTLAGPKTGKFERFELTLVDIFQRTHTIYFLGVNHIGNKTKIPEKQFQHLCKSFSLDPSKVQNTGGSYELLLGLDACKLLGAIDDLQSSTEFPNVGVWNSPLSDKPFFVGTIGASHDDFPNLRTTCFYNGFDNIAIDIDNEELEQMDTGSEMQTSTWPQLEVLLLTLYKWLLFVLKLPFLLVNLVVIGLVTTILFLASHAGMAISWTARTLAFLIGDSFSLLPQFLRGNSWWVQSASAIVNCLWVVVRRTRRRQRCVSSRPCHHEAGPQPHRVTTPVYTPEPPTPTPPPTPSAPPPSYFDPPSYSELRLSYEGYGIVDGNDHDNDHYGSDGQRLSAVPTEVEERHAASHLQTVDENLVSQPGRRQNKRGGGKMSARKTLTLDEGTLPSNQSNTECDPDSYGHTDGHPGDPTVQPDPAHGQAQYSNVTTDHGCDDDDTMIDLSFLDVLLPVREDVLAVCMDNDDGYNQSFHSNFKHSNVTIYPVDMQAKYNYFYNYLLDQENHLNCRGGTSESDNRIVSFAGFQTKRSCASIPDDQLTPISRLMCDYCTKAVASCSSCKYINSSQSVREAKELELMRQSIKEEPQADGTIKLYVSYLQYVPSHIAFTRKNAMEERSKSNAERLRNTLIKNNLLEPFDKIMKETLEREHVVLVPEDERPDICNYLLLNFQRKQSQSQPTRPVSNCSAKNRQNYDLNSNSLKGPSLLGSGLVCYWHFRLGAVAFCADVSRFYRSVYTYEDTNTLRRYHWYTNVHDPSTLREFKFRVASYGDSPISLLSELCVNDHIAPKCKTEKLKTVLQTSRLVDDFMGCVSDIKTVKEIQDDAIETFAKFNFKIKQFYYSFMPPDDPETDYTNISVLATSWDCQLDTIKPIIEFYPLGSRRGMKLEPKMSRETVPTLELSKTVLSRIAGQCFDYCSLTGPIQASLRLAFSMACKVLDKDDWDTSLSKVDPELDKQIKSMLMNICNLPKDLKPYPRSVCPQDHKIVRIIVSSDGSATSVAYSCHIVAEHIVTGHRICNLFTTRSHIFGGSVPQAESRGISEATKRQIEMFRDIPMFGEIENLELIFVTDSLVAASLFSPTLVIRDIGLRNSVYVAVHNIKTLVSSHPNLCIKLTHGRSESIPSDYLSKFTVTPTELTNSDLFRHGPDYWCSHDWPAEERVFYTACHGKEPVFRAPTAEQHDIIPTNLVQCLFNKQSLSQTMMSVQEGVLEPVNHCFSYNTSVHNDDTETHVSTAATNSLTGRINRPIKPGLYQPNDWWEGEHVEITVLQPMTYINYMSLLLLSNNLSKIVNILTIMLSWVWRLRTRGKKALRRYVFSKIMKTHQKFFTLKNLKGVAKQVDTFGIHRILTRIDSSDQQVVDMTCHPPLVSTDDPRLVYLLLSLF